MIYQKKGFFSNPFRSRSKSPGAQRVEKFTTESEPTREFSRAPQLSGEPFDQFNFRRLNKESSTMAEFVGLYRALFSNGTHGDAWCAKACDALNKKLENLGQCP